MKTDAVEQSRLDAIRRYDLLDRTDGAFDRITKFAAKLLGFPIVIVSVVDRDRIWFMSHHGINADQMARGPGLCAQVVITEKPHVINDAALNPTTSHLPAVSELGIRFYAGVPLINREGHCLGTLCAIDTVPREFSEEQLNLLKEMAELVMDEIELRQSMRKILDLESQLLKNALEAKAKAEHIANHDHLTGLANRMYFTHVLEEEILSAAGDRIPAVLMLDLDKFKAANDTFGHQMGDAILKEVANRIRSVIGENDLAARLGGDEFVILKKDTTGFEAENTARKLVDILALPYELEGQVAHLSSSVGVALFTIRDNSRQLIRHADLALYQAKGKGGKNFQVYGTITIDPMTQTRHR